MDEILECRLCIKLVDCHFNSVIVVHNSSDTIYIVLIVNSIAARLCSYQSEEFNICAAPISSCFINAH